MTILDFIRRRQRKREDAALVRAVEQRHGTPMEAIDFAIEADDEWGHGAGVSFLRDWREGEVWPQFGEWRKARRG